MVPFPFLLLSTYQLVGSSSLHSPSFTLQDKTLDLKTPSGERFTSLQVGLVCQLVHSKFDECRATPKDDNRIMHIKKLDRADITTEVSSNKVAFHYSRVID